MDAKELAEKMLEYGDAQTKADELRAEIEDAVLVLGATQTVGNVKATYRNPRKTYDYKTAGRTANPSVIIKFTTQLEPKVDWKKVCAEIEADVPYNESSAGVTVKLVS